MDIYEELEPQRYSVDCGIVDTDGQGEYVLYSDYKKVADRLELMLQKIATAAKDINLWNGETQLTGPHCILFVEDFASIIKSHSFTEEEAMIEAREVFIESAFNEELRAHPDFKEIFDLIRAGTHDDMPMLQIAKQALLHSKPIT